MEHSIAHIRSLVQLALLDPSSISDERELEFTGALRTDRFKNRRTVDKSVCTSLVDGSEHHQQIVLSHETVSCSETKNFSKDKPLFKGSIRQSRIIKDAIGQLSPMQQLWIKYAYGASKNKYAEITLQFWLQNEFFELMEGQDINEAAEFIRAQPANADVVFRTLREKTKVKIRLLAPFAVRNGAHLINHGEPLFSSKALYGHVNTTKDNWNKRLAPMWRLWMAIIKYHDSHTLKTIYESVYPQLFTSENDCAGPHKIRKCS